MISNKILSPKLKLETIPFILAYKTILQQLQNFSYKALFQLLSIKFLQ